MYDGIVDWDVGCGDSCVVFSFDERDNEGGSGLFVYL